MSRTETIIFTLTQIHKYDEESFWTAGKMVWWTPEMEEEEDSLPSRGTASVSGLIPLAAVGKKFQAQGEWNTHPKFGRQFTIPKTGAAEEILPVTEDELTAYLSSGFISGVGPKYAKRIVARFGLQTPEIIAKHPERLREVSGIGAKRSASIHESWCSTQEIRRLASFLLPYGVTTNQILKIYSRFGMNSRNIIQKNPYRLTEIRGIGFLLADSIALRLGLARDNPQRIESGIFYILHEEEQEGNVCMNQNRLLWKAKDLLGLDAGPIKEEISVMKLPSVSRKNGKEISRPPKLMTREQDIYFHRLYMAEKSIADRLLAIQDSGGFFPYPEVYPEEIGWREYENLRNPKTGEAGTYSKKQIEAISLSAHAKVMILTGGPGTGKTTVMKAILQSLEARNKKVLLAAPTGRAAKRMNESAGKDGNAKTIHRLLKYKPDLGFERNRFSPLVGDTLILDECSMIDVSLMSSLLEAVPDEMQLIFIGDVDQLPSVGPGTVFRDLIESGQFPVVRLDVVHRQGLNSTIPDNSEKINQGIPPKHATDFALCFSQYSRDPQQTPEEHQKQTQLQALNALHYALVHYPEYTFSEIQILAPMHKGLCGTDALNLAVEQERRRIGTNRTLWRQPAQGVDYLVSRNGKKYLPKIPFAKGEKVMQTRNNYSLHVFNGDIGIVEFYGKEYPEDQENIVRVSYPDGKDEKGQPKFRLVTYPKKDQIDLIPAYAITIHKSQGSEFPVVIVPLLEEQSIMLQRSLLYTAVTRAKRQVILVGDTRAMETAIQNNQTRFRHGHLRELLQRKYEILPEYPLSSAVRPGSTVLAVRKQVTS